MNDASISRRAALAAALAAIPLPLRRALAAYPEGPVNWIVAYAAGGGSDTLARILGEAMSPKLGQAVVIENRPGGATNIGAAAAAKAEPDGQTVFTADNGTLVFNPALFKKLPYDPDRDFRPVGLMARFPLFLVVKKDSASTSARDFIERARAEPGSIDYGSPGIGSPHHLTMERLAREAGVSLTHVPYKGAAPALNDLVGGHVESMVLDYPSGAGQLRTDSIRPLAVCSAARFAGLPDVPTVQEALGLAKFEAYAWQGLVVPKATPDPIVERLTTELADALHQEHVLARMREVGLEPLAGGPAEFRALLEAERGVWVPLIKSLRSRSTEPQARRAPGSKLREEMMSYEFKPYPFTARRYEAKLPALTDGIETKRHAVAIVGGGPVGLALALGLANHGVASVLIEADDTVCFGSRAICISRRSLEIIERLEALQGFLEKGLPWTGGRSFYRDTEVLHFAMPHDENQKLPPMVNIEQFYIEQFLLDAAEKRADLIDIRWQTRATGIRVQDERRDAQPFHTEGRLHACTRIGWRPATAAAAKCGRRSACSSRARVTKAAT